MEATRKRTQEREIRLKEKEAVRNMSLDELVKWVEEPDRGWVAQEATIVQQLRRLEWEKKVLEREMGGPGEGAGGRCKCDQVWKGCTSSKRLDLIFLCTLARLCAGAPPTRQVAQDSIYLKGSVLELG